MSDTRDPDTDQPLPVVNDRPFVQDLVVADIEERKLHGIRKYGTALQSGNGRDMLQDAYEEALDLAIYLRGAIDERDHAGRCGYPRCISMAGHRGRHVVADDPELVRGVFERNHGRHFAEAPPAPRPERLPSPRAAVLQPSRAFPYLPAMAVCVALVLIGCALIVGGELGWLR